MSETAHRTAGKTAYLTDTLLGAVTPSISPPTPAGAPIPSGAGAYTILFGQGASIGYLVGEHQIVPLNTVTNTTLRPIKLPLVMDWGAAATPTSPTFR